MTRYLVQAWATSDAWAYVDADTPENALEQAHGLTARDFELGDVIDVELESAAPDA